MATKTSATQTSSWDMDLDKAPAKINEEMSIEHLPQQARESGATPLRVYRLSPLVRERGPPREK